MGSAGDKSRHMGEMVDRVKRAFIETYWIPGEGWEERCVRAVILAMREPTDRMIRVGYAASFQGSIESPAAFAAIWQAMIDAALEG